MNEPNDTAIPMATDATAMRWIVPVKPPVLLKLILLAMK
jgi:hypothetical protein